MNIHTLLLSLVAGFTLSACAADEGSSSAADASPKAEAATECQPAESAPTWTAHIAPIFERHCTNCHTEDSALVPRLVTYADLVATNGAGVPLYERSAVRVHEANMPPPNLEPMTPEEKEAVSAWAAACAPERSR